jgi:hypothetical protein
MERNIIQLKKEPLHDFIRWFAIHWRSDIDAHLTQGVEILSTKPIIYSKFKRPPKIILSLWRPIYFPSQPHFWSSIGMPLCQV